MYLRSCYTSLFLCCVHVCVRVCVCVCMYVCVSNKLSLILLSSVTWFYVINLDLVGQQLFVAKKLTLDITCKLFNQLISYSHTALMSTILQWLWHRLRVTLWVKSKTFWTSFITQFSNDYDEVWYGVVANMNMVISFILRFTHSREVVSVSLTASKRLNIGMPFVVCKPISCKLSMMTVTTELYIFIPLLHDLDFTLWPLGCKKLTILHWLSCNAKSTLILMKFDVL